MGGKPDQLHLLTGADAFGRVFAPCGSARTGKKQACSSGFGSDSLLLPMFMMPGKFWQAQADSTSCFIKIRGKVRTDSRTFGENPYAAPSQSYSIRYGERL